MVQESGLEKLLLRVDAPERRGSSLIRLTLCWIYRFTCNSSSVWAVIPPPLPGYFLIPSDPITAAAPSFCGSQTETSFLLVDTETRIWPFGLIQLKFELYVSMRRGRRGGGPVPRKMGLEHRLFCFVSIWIQANCRLVLLFYFYLPVASFLLFQSASSYE